VICTFLALGVVRSYFIRSYVRTGVAVPVPRSVGVSYPNGLPSVLSWLRVGFFGAVVAMLLFGLIPIPRRTAEIGIIACVVSLFLVGVLNVVVERHKVNTGEATDDYRLPK
jgi:hypothetical protein